MRHIVLGFFFQHVFVFGQSLGLTVVLEQPVANHHAIVQVVGMFLGQLLQLVQRFFLAAHLLIDVHARKSNLLAAAVGHLYAVDGLNHAGIVFLLIVELQQHIQNVGAVFIVGIKALVNGNGTVEVVFVHIDLCQPFQIVAVVGIEFCGLLETFHDHGILFQFAVIGRKQIIGLGRHRIDFPTMAQEVEGGIIASPMLLIDSFEEKVLVAQAVVMGKRFLDLKALGRWTCKRSIIVARRSTARHKPQGNKGDGPCCNNVSEE